jgi:hypothetical protein
MRSIFKRRFLGILGFGLLFILIDLVKPTKVEACHFGWILSRDHHSSFELLKCKVKNATDDINPVNYFKNKKKCQARADRQDTVAEGKKQYKRCMDNPNDY